MSYRYKLIKKFRNPEALVDTIYKNFIHLAGETTLKHNHQDILRLLTSGEMTSLLVYHNNVLIAYLIGETLNLQDGRLVFYINYLYVAKNFRHQGIGDRLVRTCIQHCRNNGPNFITLTCDTENENIVLFYKKKGFMPDPIIRQFTRYDVMSIFL